MSLPGPAVQWPQNAVTILVLGGDDYFRAGTPAREYVANAKRRVPRGNSSTAILFIMEMEHMPQPGLMGIMLKPLLLAATHWKSSGRPPVDTLTDLWRELEGSGWNGQLSYLSSPDNWVETSFGETAAEQPDSPQALKAAKANKRHSEMLNAYKREEETVAELEKQVEDAEARLQELRGELATAKERARKLKEAAGIATGPTATTESTADAGHYVKGQKVRYWSISQKGWVDCEVVATRNGAIQINVKPDAWLPIELQATHIRSREARSKSAHPAQKHQHQLSFAPQAVSQAASGSTVVAGGVYRASRSVSPSRAISGVSAPAWTPGGGSVQISAAAPTPITHRSSPAIPVQGHAVTSPSSRAVSFGGVTSAQPMGQATSGGYSPTYGGSRIANFPMIQGTSSSSSAQIPLPPRGSAGPSGVVSPTAISASSGSPARVLASQGSFHVPPAGSSVKVSASGGSPTTRQAPPPMTSQANPQLPVSRSGQVMFQGLPSGSSGSTSAATPKRYVEGAPQQQQQRGSQQINYEVRQV